jgi:hypothetical protein
MVKIATAFLNIHQFPTVFDHSRQNAHNIYIGSNTNIKSLRKSCGRWRHVTAWLQRGQNTDRLCNDRMRSDDACHGEIALHRAGCHQLARWPRQDAAWQRHAATGSCGSLVRRHRQAGKLIGYDPQDFYINLDITMLTLCRPIYINTKQNLSQFCVPYMLTSNYLLELPQSEASKNKTNVHFTFCQRIDHSEDSTSNMHKICSI